MQADALRAAARQRREAVQLRNVVADKEMQEAVSVEDTLGKRQPGDDAGRHQHADAADAAEHRGPARL